MLIKKSRTIFITKLIEKELKAILFGEEKFQSYDERS